MKDVDLLLATNEAFRFVKCEFPNGAQLYTYKTVLDLQEGDSVVVETPKGLSIVKVVKVCMPHETTVSTAYDIKWVVQKVETEAYIKLQAQEQEATKLLEAAKTKRLVSDLQDSLSTQVGKESMEQIIKLTRL